MIKVFRLSDLIKYFIKFIIPIIIIIICLNIFIKKGNNGQQKLNDKENLDTNTKVENIKEKNVNSLDEKQEDSKLSKLNEKYESSKLKSKLFNLFKKKDSNNTETDVNQKKDSNNTETDVNQKKDNNNAKSNKAYYFCINNEIINLKNIKDETKIDLLSLLKKIIQSEFVIFNQSENADDYNEKNSGDSSIQKIVEYSLGLTPIKFNNTNDNNTNSQSKNQDVNNSSKNAEGENNKDLKENQNNNENNSNEANDSNEGDNSIKQAEENVKTEVVSNSVNSRYNYDYNGIKIYNSTKYKLTNEMLDTSNFSVNKNKILIYHTHTCESYTPTEKYNYQQTGNFRTTDLNFSVVRVGEELKKQLESYNIKVVQNKTYHDYPSYNGSYSRSLTTANNMLNENKDADIVIDLHRDAIADSSYAPKVKIGDEYVSQVMFVIGTDIANSANSHWNENLKFAVKAQQKANEMYPRTI